MKKILNFLTLLILIPTLTSSVSACNFIDEQCYLQFNFPDEIRVRYQEKYEYKNDRKYKKLKKDLKIINCRQKKLGLIKEVDEI